MAEFCVECTRKLERDIQFVVLSEDNDLCEGCGEWRLVITSLGCERDS